MTMSLAKATTLIVGPTGGERLPPLLLAVKAGSIAYMIPFNRKVNKVVTDTTSCVCALWFSASCVSAGGGLLPPRSGHYGGRFYRL
jgi:hypothetical protein